MAAHPTAAVAQPAYDEVAKALSRPEIQSRLDELLRRYPVKRAALLEVLWLVQAEIGWVPTAGIRWAAERCEVSPAHAYGVATFYTMYRKAPVGRFHIQVCQNVACHIQDSEALIGHAEKVLGIGSHGQTTPDGLFTLERVECLGACGNGPAMQVNDRFATDVVNGDLAMPENVGASPERFDRIVAWCRKRAKDLVEEPRIDPLGGIPLGSDGHPGATGATSAAQKNDYAPPPPALGVAAKGRNDAVVLTWRAAPETTQLHIERKRASDADFVRISSVSAKDKEYVDAGAELGQTAEYRIVAESAGRLARPSHVARAAAEAILRAEAGKDKIVLSIQLASGAAIASLVRQSGAATQEIKASGGARIEDAVPPGNYSYTLTTKAGATAIASATVPPPEAP